MTATKRNPYTLIEQAMSLIAEAFEIRREQEEADGSLIHRWSHEGPVGDLRIEIIVTPNTKG